MRQTLIVFVQDEPGVLNRISNHFQKRNFNIESIVAGHTEKKGITRMTVVLNEPDKTKQKIVVSSLKQLIDVFDIVDVTEINSYIREYAMVKMVCKKEEIQTIKKLIEPIRGNIIDENDDALVIEVTGNEEIVEETINKLEQFKILEIVRSGKIAMVAGNKKEHRPNLKKTEQNWATNRVVESF